MKWQSLSFRTKLILSFSLATLTGFTVMGTTSYLFTEKLLRQLVNEKLETQMRGIDDSIKLAFEENDWRQNELMNQWQKTVLPKLKLDTTSTQTIEATNQVTQEKVKVTIPTLLYEGQKLDSHNVVDQLAAASMDTITFFVKINEGLLRVSTSVVKEDGKRAVGTFIPPSSPVYQKVVSGERYVGRARVLNQWYMSAYQPIFQDKQVVGAFFMGSPEVSSEKMRAYLKTQKIFRTGYFFILDSQGTLLLHPSKEGQPALPITDLDGRSIFKEIIDQKNGMINYHWLNAETQRPQSKMAIFHYLPQLDWYVAASFNKDEAEEVLGSLRWIILTVSMASVFGMILMSGIYGHRVSKNLKSLSGKLLQVTLQTSRESTELASSSEQLSSAATEAAASLEETVASLEEINSQVQNNLKMTEETNSLGKKSLETVRSSESKVKALSEFMIKIQEDSKQIREISSLIDDIAFQTNLLSLNAAVEAARAGEHGKGFAVVAEAVRSLAAKSAESAKQITNMIQASSDRIEKVVRANAEVDHSFHEIVDNIQKLSSLVEEMTRASEEQASGVSQISKAMNQLDMTTQSNSQLAENISGASSQLSSHSENLRTSVHDLDQMIQGEGSTQQANVPSANDSTSDDSFSIEKKQQLWNQKKADHAARKRSA